MFIFVTILVVSLLLETELEKDGENLVSLISGLIKDLYTTIEYRRYETGKSVVFMGYDENYEKYMVIRGIGVIE